MSRTITVRGTGKISKAPDQIALLLSLECTDIKYDKVGESANRAITFLTVAVNGAGLDEKELKTQSYQIDTDYDNVRNKDGNYHRVFNGYVCRICTAIRFPLDMKLLGLVLHTISECKANPEIGIHFELADEDAAKDEMLVEAAKDAKKKAELLAKAADVSLGQLQSIQYAWDEIKFESPTTYACCEEATCAPAPGGLADITPEDVERSDTAVFVWEIV